ncbi:MAG: C10 family peptidase [Candidatus Eisenbacteria bacterium]|nr:C10 family peptidase [Candidatus Eisenbacteria bacterium]
MLCRNQNKHWYLQNSIPGLLILILLGVLSLLPLEARAETATADEMETVATNWLATMVHQHGDWAGEIHPRIESVQEIRVGETLLARCYSIFPQGHIVVPVLMEMSPVKVSSETCGLDVQQAQGFPQLLREILKHRAQLFMERYGSLAAAQPATGEVLFDRAHRETWDRYLAHPADFARSLGEDPLFSRGEVGPLLTTAWHQGDPYNNYAPMGDGGRCVVGCVATATAQIMRYWNWPPRGVSGWSYYWGGDTSCGGSSPGDWLYAEFSDPYDWDNMPNSCTGGCTPEQEDALAELNYEVGIAFEMVYGACGSGAYTSDIIDVLPNYFRYDNTINEVSRSSHDPDSWFHIIQDEIDAGRPMAYSFRYSATEGHAIVCDGWRDTQGFNQYHMNYGWGGSYNAWFSIDAIYHTYDIGQEKLYRRIMPKIGYVFTVLPDGSGDYPTIQAAIDDVLDADIIELGDGVFTGEGNRDLNFNGHPITVRSAGGDPEYCIIDCEGNPEEHRGFNFVSGEGASSVLEGITIRNGYMGADSSGAAIVCANNSSPTIRNCLIRDSESLNNGGGILCSGSSPLITESIFSSNLAAGNGGAIIVQDGAQPSITHCTFFANGALAGGALWISDDSAAEFENGIIVSGTGGGAVQCEGGVISDPLVCCDIFNNTGGDWVGCIADQYGVDGNISEDPLFCDQENENFHLQSESPCRADYNPTCGQIGALPLGCDVVIVSADGSGDFPTIQEAIDASLDGYIIELTNGIYVGDGNRNLDFGGRAITLRSQSGNPYACVIDCQGSESSTQRGFYFHSAEGPDAVVEGIKVRNGYRRYDSGGAAWCRDASNPTFINCVFSNNHTGISGGAIYCSGQSDASFINCTFYDNSADNGGAIYVSNSLPVISNCTFADNAAEVHGSALCTNSNTFNVQNSLFAYNDQMEAVHCLSQSVILSCCDIYGNSGGDWVGSIAGQEGVDGNICEDPLFCNPQIGDYAIAIDSPCAPFSPPNVECDLIGAWGTDTCDPSAVDSEPLPWSVHLGQAAPNPFRQSTTITYTIPGGSGGVPVHLNVFDPAGRLVRTLVNEDRSAGIHHVKWDGRNDNGAPVASGIYFYQLPFMGEKQTKRIVLIR